MPEAMTNAVPMIIGEIRRYLRDNNPIRVSRSLRDIAYKALQVRDNLTNSNSREPTIYEISEALNVPKEDVVFALDAIQDPVSLFEPIYHDGHRLQISASFGYAVAFKDADTAADLVWAADRRMYAHKTRRKQRI